MDGYFGFPLDNQCISMVRIIASHISAENSGSIQYENTPFNIAGELLSQLA
jgi:hypothetical protein